MHIAQFRNYRMSGEYCAIISQCIITMRCNMDDKKFIVEFLEVYHWLMALWDVKSINNILVNKKWTVQHGDWEISWKISGHWQARSFKIKKTHFFVDKLLEITVTDLYRLEKSGVDDDEPSLWYLNGSILPQLLTAVPGLRKMLQQQ